MGAWNSAYSRENETVEMPCYCQITNLGVTSIRELSTHFSSKDSSSHNKSRLFLPSAENFRKVSKSAKIRNRYTKYHI